MSHSAIDIITGEFQSSLSDLVECYAGVVPEISPTSTDDISQNSAAIIGFGDAGFRGSAVLLAHDHVAVKLAHSTPQNPKDWLGELSNQLIGRMKNKLSKYGLLPYLGTPVTVSGRDLDLGSVGVEPTAWTVSWSDCSLISILTLEVEEGLELFADENAIPAEEGSLNLF